MQDPVVELTVKTPKKISLESIINKCSTLSYLKLVLLLNFHIDRDIHAEIRPLNTQNQMTDMGAAQDKHQSSQITTGQTYAYLYLQHDSYLSTTVKSPSKMIPPLKTPPSPPLTATMRLITLTPPPVTLPHLQTKPSTMQTLATPKIIRCRVP